MRFAEMVRSGSQLGEMLAAIGKALAIFAPIGVVATILLNVLEPSPAVVIAVVMTISGAASLVGALFDIRYQDARESSRPRPRGPAGA